MRKGARARGLTDTPPVELKSTAAQSLVVGSGLVVAAANVPKQVREDLVNCTLFAQLAASGEVGNAAKVIDWYDAYFRALTALGWAQSDTQFEKLQVRQPERRGPQGHHPGADRADRPAGRRTHWW